MKILKKQWLPLILLCILFLAPGLLSAQASGAQISGVAWLDKTIDGYFNNESGLSDVKITLERKNADGTVSALASMETQRDGMFAFAVSEAGEYRLSIEAPEDYHFTYHRGDGSSALPAQGNCSATPFFTVTDGDFITKDFGMTKYSSYVSFNAFVDENANGGRMLSEPVIRDALLELIYEFEGETYLIATDTTDRNGEASIRELSPGVYRVRATLPDENYVMGPMGEKVNAFYNCIVAGEGNTGLSEPFTLEARDSLGIGVGAVLTGSLTGKIWYDANFNGVWDHDETGLTDALITLSSNSIDLKRETYADENGNYAFRGMQPGSYQLIVSLPEGMIFTYPGASVLSDIAAVGEVNASIQVETTTQIKPIGTMPATAMTLFLYEDANLNGVWDLGEGFVPGAEIAVSQAGKTVETLFTAEDGVAHFATLRGGDTQLECTLPEGYVFAHAGDALFPVIGAANTATAQVQLDGEADVAHYVMGVTRPASVSGMLFEDPANTGLYENGYSLLSGFTVQAIDENGAVALETKTDDNGAYTLYPLYPGDYTVRFLLNDPYIAAPYAADQAPNANSIYAQTPAYGECQLLGLAAGDAVTSVNGAVFRAGIIQGRVLLNANHDSLATNEGGMPGITVTLLDEFGAPVSDYSYSISDENGQFMIKGVEPGAYSLVYSLPENCAFAAPMTDLTEVGSSAFTVESGSQIHLADVGVVKTSVLSGKILHLDTPVAATLRLTAQKFGTVYETSTLEDGQYIFSGLRPDTYELTVTLPEGYVVGMNAASPVPAAAANSSSATLTFAMGDMRTDANISAAQPASLSGVIFYDVNSSCVMDADETVDANRAYSLWLGNEMIASGASDAAGAFRADNLVPGVYTLRLSLNSQEIMPGSARQEGAEWAMDIAVGDGENVMDYPVPVLRYASLSGAVWSLDGTYNGVGNIQVALLDMYGNVLNLVNTDAQGAFTFGNLLPGNYALSAVLPQGYMFARAQDAMHRPSYVQGMPDGTAQALLIQLPMGENLIGLDIGIGALGAIGDRAWLDENGNGMQDIGEPDMPGILIELYQYDQLIASATTDLYGRYSLTNLYPGEYQMKVTMHAEIKPTAQQSEFPLVASILPESKDTVVTVQSVIVPSGGENLHCDLGFQLRKDNKYPAIMDEIPVKDWRPYSERGE